MRTRQSKGSATAELAVCLPLLIVLILGGMEAANGIFLKQALTVAAYETAKMATTVGYTAAEAEARGLEILTARGFVAADIVLVPPNTEDMAPGELVTVTVSAPATTNAITPLVFHAAGMNVTAVVAMNRN